jgi:hypothetical protein
MMKLNFEKDKLIILLLITDLFFVILHILFMYTDLITNYIFAIWRDRGPAEFFQYIKYLWVLVLFLVLFFVRRKALFLVFSALFLYFLVDDFFEGHETVGGMLVERLDLPSLFNLRPQDLGEMLVYAVVGGFFFTLIAFFHFRSDPYTRLVSRIMIVLILLLAFFGIGVDMVAMLFENPSIEAFFNLLEDGGEMVAMSLITWFVFRLDPSSDAVPIFNKKPAVAETKIEKLTT